MHGRLLSAIWLASFSSAAITSLAAAAEQVVASASPAPATTKSTELAPIQLNVQLAVQLINSHIRQAWKDQDLAPSPAATDGEWCRRVYLDLIGRVPTVEELRRSSRDRKRDKRERLVDRLLGDEYRDEYVRNWTTIWTNMLIGRTGGTERRSLVDREGMDAVSARGARSTTSRTTRWCASW